MFLDRLIECGPRLNKAEHQLAVVLAREILGYRVTQRDLGEGLLRERTRQDGRTFLRTRDGLMEKGLVRYAAPALRGRGYRNHYDLLLKDDAHPVNEPDRRPEGPAQTQDFTSREETADERGSQKDSPARSPARSPAPERG